MAVEETRELQVSEENNKQKVLKQRNAKYNHLSDSITGTKLHSQDKLLGKLMVKASFSKKPDFKAEINDKISKLNLKL